LDSMASAITSASTLPVGSSGIWSAAVPPASLVKNSCTPPADPQNCRICLALGFRQPVQVAALPADQVGQFCLCGTPVLDLGGIDGLNSAHFLSLGRAHVGGLGVGPGLIPSWRAARARFDADQVGALGLRAVASVHSSRSPGAILICSPSAAMVAAEHPANWIGDRRQSTTLDLERELQARPS